MRCFISVILVEPEGKDLQQCLISGKRLQSEHDGYLPTIAEGIKLKEVCNFLRYRLFITLTSTSIRNA